MDHYSTSYGHHTTCPFKLMTGVPCPGCGMGRATIALFKGDLTASLYSNILCIPFTIVVWTLVFWMVIDLIRRRETIFPYLTRPASTPLTLLLLILISTGWVLNIVHKI
jgi:hypothetical protein